MEIGEKILIGNPEDAKNLRVLEVNDVYEVSLTETYFEIIEYNLLRVGGRVVKGARL